MSKYTPGPWRWEINRRSKTIELVGGRPRFDKIVMDFERWGMSGAAPRFNAEITGDELNIMFRVSDRADWIAPFPGRDHHADWCAAVTHPDAVLIAAAPDLLAICEELAESADYWSEYDVPIGIVQRLKDAIAKATGEMP